MNSQPAKNWRETKKFSIWLGKMGRLLVWTKIYAAPSGFEYQVPYFCGIVKFNGKKMAVQIVDCLEEDLKTNMKVKIVLRRLKKPDPVGLIDYSLKVKPV